MSIFRALVLISLWMPLNVIAANHMHPDVQLLDRNGQPAVVTGLPMASDVTCNDCHDGQFITQNHDHPQHIATNCLLCHTDNYDADAYFTVRDSNAPSWAMVSGLQQGRFVRKNNDAWLWRSEVIANEGTLDAATLGIKASDSEACGQCHGIVYAGSEPLTIGATDTIGRLTRLEGAIYSGQKLSVSGLNIAGKATQDRAFDVHAERLLECTDCHRAANNPIHGGAHGENLSHLKYDPRQSDLSSYLERPDHNLMIGVAGGDGSCKGCHEPEDNHSWLPETERHFATVSCQACHITELYGPALKLVDDTVRDATGAPVLEWRSKSKANNATLGFEPLLLQRANDGKWAPYNVTLYRFWRDAATNETISEAMVDLAWANSQQSNASVFGAMTAAFTEMGVAQAEIATVITPTAINHGVSRDSFALSECEACHTLNGRMQMSLSLGPMPADYRLPTGQDVASVPKMAVSLDSQNQLHVSSADSVDLELRNNTPILLSIGGLVGVFVLFVVWRRFKRSER